MLRSKLKNPLAWNDDLEVAVFSRANTTVSDLCTAKIPGLQSAHPMNVQSIMTAMTPKYIAKSCRLGTDWRFSLLVGGGCDRSLPKCSGREGTAFGEFVSWSLTGNGSLILSVEMRPVSPTKYGGLGKEMSREQSDSLKDEPSMLWRESLLSALPFSFGQPMSCWCSNREVVQKGL